jgi:hypothetical protein
MNLDVSQIPAKEAQLNKQLHDSVQGLLNMNQDEESPARVNLAKVS